MPTLSENRMGVSLQKAWGVDSMVEKKGITGSTIKLIAIIAMFIDHIGAVILEKEMMNRGAGMMGDVDAMLASMEQNAMLYGVDTVFRLIGRIGFPIFCFLLIEGFMHTRNMKKYAGRLFLFALISEIPFNLAFSGKFIYTGYQNVFFTLLAGLLVMMGFRLIEEKQNLHKALSVLLHLLILAAGMAAAEFMNTDYSAFGVLTIAVMYYFRNKKTLSAVMGCATLTVMSLAEITAFFAVIPISRYNGQRGWNIKWLFYAFYPAHILLLYLISCALGISQLPF